MLGTITSNRILVACPSCLAMGKSRILGEVKEGYLLIKRFGQGFTKISGSFEVTCDLCQEPVYFRSERRGTINEMLTYGQLGVFGTSSMQTAGTIRV